MESPGILSKVFEKSWNFDAKRPEKKNPGESWNLNQSFWWEPWLKALVFPKLLKTRLKGPGATYKQKQFAVTIIHKIFKKNSSFHVK